MKIELVNIDDLDLDPRNARKHDTKNLKAIADSLELFGQRKPIVVWGRTVVAGNGTMVAARSLGWTEITVARVPDDWSADQVKAYALADNRSAELAEWDEQVLAAQLLELTEAEFDVELLGFELPADELQDVIEDDMPEVVEPKTKLGDVWQLGKHRVMCGDSSDRDTVDKLMRGEKAKIVYTDPPYGMNLDTDYTKMGDGGKSHRAVIADDKQFNARFLLDTFSYCKEIFLWGADYYVETLERKYPELGSWIIWDKYSDERIGLLDGRFGSTFETCWSKTPHKREIAQVLVTTNYTARGDETRVHPTQKPVELSAWFINKFTKANDLLVDLYGGSGSTLIACEQTDRVCFMMELDPKYVDVIIARWEKLTGKQAQLIEG